MNLLIREEKGEGAKNCARYNWSVGSIVRGPDMTELNYSSLWHHLSAPCGRLAPFAPKALWRRLERQIRVRQRVI